jgi:hypothetical protein
MIEYIYTSEGITPPQLQGFFEGWPDPPSPETHLRLLASCFIHRPLLAPAL